MAETASAGSGAGSVSSSTPGALFRGALAAERPLQIAGAVNAYCARLAEDAGFRAVYLSGAGVANACFALPDLGMTSLAEVAEETRRITAAVAIPLLVDIDTGWGSVLNMERTIQTLERAGAAAVHFEDQVEAKRCGHRPGKQLVSTAEMVTRIRAAVAARRDESFFLMARTDAAAVEGLDAAIARACRYVEAGADGIFAEALTNPDDFRRFADVVSVPVLANMTEFGKTPLMSREELASRGVAMALYPLTAFRAMSAAAAQAYATLRRDGSQRALLSELQTREELYRVLRYHEYEQRLSEDTP